MSRNGPAAWVVLSAVAGAAAVALPASSSSRWEPLALPAPLATLLDTGRWDATPPGFRTCTCTGSPVKRGT